MKKVCLYFFISLHSFIFCRFLSDGVLYLEVGSYYLWGVRLLSQDFFKGGVDHFFFSGGFGKKKS